MIVTFEAVSYKFPISFRPRYHRTFVHEATSNVFAASLVQALVSATFDRFLGAPIQTN